MNMSRRQLAAAYTAVKTRFGLNPRQRNALDLSEYYLTVLALAHQGHWDACKSVLDAVFRAADLPEEFEPMEWFA